MMTAREHDLKTWPHSWDATKRGEKTFEVRSNHDRDFAVGDVLLLRRWDPEARTLSGVGRGGYVRGGHPVLASVQADTIRATVTYVLHGGRFGLPHGVCVMSIRVEPESQP